MSTGYSDFVVDNSAYTLSSALPTMCIAIEAVPDVFPEYTETFYVTLNLSNPLDTPSEGRSVDIIDDDGEPAYSKLPSRRFLQCEISLFTL